MLTGTLFKESLFFTFSTRHVGLRRKHRPRFVEGPGGPRGRLPLSAAAVGAAASRQLAVGGQHAALWRQVCRHQGQRARRPQRGQGRREEIQVKRRESSFYALQNQNDW